MREKYYNFIYNKNNNVTFAYVPKVACSNWKCIMRYLEGYENFLDTTLAHDRERSGLRYMNKESKHFDFLIDRKIKNFACVRDPYGRTLSAYLNKVESRLVPENNFPQDDYFLEVTKNIEEFRRERLSTSKFPETSFEVFLLWLQDSKSHFTQDEHWCTQSELLCIDTVDFDFIGRFETLAKDAQHILAAIKCDIPFPSQKKIRFPPTNANDKIGTYFNKATIALVNKIYANDFTEFGYKVVDR